MDSKKIDRINELARKSRTEPLTAEEKQEQDALRQEYRAAMRESFRAQIAGYRFEPRKKDEHDG